MKVEEIQKILDDESIAYAVVGSSVRLKLQGVIRAKELVEAGSKEIIDVLMYLADKDGNTICQNILIAAGLIAPEPPPTPTITGHDIEEESDDLAENEEYIRGEDGEIIRDDDGEPLVKVKDIAPPPRLEREELEW